MAHIVCQAIPLHPLLPLSSSSSSSSSSLAAKNWGYPVVSVVPNLRSSSTKICCTPTPASQMDERPRFKDFPYASPAIRDLMLDLVSTVESRLSAQLVPYTLPHDVQYYQNESGTNHGSLFVLSGAPSSPIDFLLGSWLHGQLPNGAALSITNLTCYMNDLTDAPGLVMEFIQAGPTSLVAVMDLPPRRDPVLHPEYLKAIYEDTNIEKLRLSLLDSCVPSEVQPYVLQSMYFRCVFSPTSIAARIECGEEVRLDEIVREKVGPAAKKVLETWLEVCAMTERGLELEEGDREYLRKRDLMSRSKSIDIDIRTNFPGLFGHQVADRVIKELSTLMGLC